MTTVADLEVASDLEALREVASSRGWELKIIDQGSLLIRMPAVDHSIYTLLCQHGRFPSFPPAWHWSNADGSDLDQLRDTPREYGGFFHGNGVICAPWNSLAYQGEFARGPHNDWAIGDWRANPLTLECKTLTAMALRIYVQLQMTGYAGRKAA